MAVSWLSYNLQRPYPYKWFTPVAAVGVLVLFVVFSVINFASSGYNSTVEYSANPNKTTSTAFFGDWFPSLSHDVRPSCQPASVPIPSLLYTNNTALQYTLTGVQDHTGKNLPSLIYYNNPLEDCNIASVELQLQSAPGRTATQYYASRWGIVSTAHVSCRVPTPNMGYVTIDLLVQYEPVPDTVFFNSGIFKFLGRNAQTSASLYWGESLLSMSNFWLMVNMDGLTREGYAPWISMTVPLDRTGEQDVTSLDYYHARFRAVEPEMGLNITNGGTNYLPYLFSWVYLTNDTHTVGGLVNRDIGPSIWIEADNLAKVLESTILTDLGQQHTHPNILADADLIQHFSSNFSQITDYAQLNWWPLLDLNHTGKTLDDEFLVGPAIQDYNTLKDTTGPLGVKPSVFAMNYLCSVPQRKSTQSLLISLTVADLVFLQAAWLFFTLTVCFFMRRQDTEADFCQGCVARRTPGDQQALFRTRSVSNGPLLLDKLSPRHHLQRLSSRSEGPYTMMDEDIDVNGWHEQSFGMFDKKPRYTPIEVMNAG